MADINQIEQEIQTLDTMQALTRVYGEIASTRMKKTRENVVASRQFLADIESIFDDVRASYTQEVQKLIKKSSRGRKAPTITFLSHNGKKVAVFLSSNTGLYGEIIPNTFRLFMQDVASGEFEVTIVGRQGLGLFTGTGTQKPYTYFKFPEKEDEFESLSEIVEHIVLYDEVRLYYGKFESVITQKPVRQIITSEILIDDQKKGIKRKQYLFEPSLQSIMQFFETEIFASVFNHAYREGQLAKYASRILAMDRAYENIKNERILLNSQRLRIEHLIKNRKLLNSLPAVYKSI